MALNTLNTDAISFKRLVGKAHTQQGFAFSEESIGSTVGVSYTTVFGETVNPSPSGTSLYWTDGIIQKVKFQVDIIPDTLIGTNRSQGYRLKLPADWNANGELFPEFSAGTYLHQGLGKLQIVPALYGTLAPDGSTKYDPKLYQTNGVTQITKFDSINWILDTYSGVLFVQDPPVGYDISASRPGFVEAFLFVGKYLNDVVGTGATDWTEITNKPTGFTPSFHTHPISEVIGLQGALDSKINLSEKGAASGVAPLNASSIVPSIHLPLNFKEQYVVADIPARDAKFVAYTGITGSGQIFSFEGLRVLVINATGDTNPPPILSGSSEYVDATGLLDWVRVSSSSQVILDWTTITGKPPLVNQIYAGSGISLMPTGGTGNTTISVVIDGNYLENIAPNGNISIKDNILDVSKIKFQNGVPGSTGQFIVRGTGDTFLAISPPPAFSGISSITAQNGVVDIGTPTNPVLEVLPDGGDDTIQVNVNGVSVKANSLGTNKLKFGSFPFGINADIIPLNTGSTYTSATDVGTALEQLKNLSTIALTGATNVGTGTGNIVREFSGNTVHARTIKRGQYVSIVQNPNDITIAVTGITATTGFTGVIGPAEDGTYTDGLFTDFVPSTPVGTAVDRFNEVLKAIAPPPAPNLTGATASGTFVSGKLSWGSSKAIAGFTNVGTNAGNAAVDINGNYAISGTRKGITSSPITGVLNSSVVGIAGIPYDNTAFGDGHLGVLIMYKNGVLLSTLILAATTAATSNSRMAVTAVQGVKFPSGQPLNVFTYRTGTFNIPVSAMTNGYNYIRIVHSGATFSRQTNFVEWTYDPDVSNIGLIAPSGLTNVSLGGTKYVSGVVYRTGGTVQYQGTFSNAYKNVFSNSATAIDFTGKENLGAISVMDVTGAGIVNRLASPLQTLPDLDILALDPQNTNISVLATMPINVNTLLGNVGVTGRLRSSVAVAHPFAGQSFAGGQSTTTGFLVYNINQATNLNNEDFNGETDRLEARDYSVLTYANINAGTYAWTSSQNLISGNAQHNTGLLVFNGELMYPNAAYLTSTYGITTGNFGAVTYAAGGNPNYTAAGGGRDYYRKFKSANGATQATLTFAISHTGVLADFLTNGGTGGVPAGNQLKVEFLIKRSGGATHGWANPFASTGNPEGIAVTSAVHSLGVTTVTCTLATTPRVALNDIVIVRIFTANGYSNRILNLANTNI